MRAQIGALSIGEQRLTALPDKYGERNRQPSRVRLQGRRVRAGRGGLGAGEHPGRRRLREPGGAPGRAHRAGRVARIPHPRAGWRVPARQREVIGVGCARPRSRAHSCSVKAIWIPAFAGMTAKTRKRHSREASPREGGERECIELQVLFRMSSLTDYGCAAAESMWSNERRCLVEWNSWTVRRCLRHAAVAGRSASGRRHPDARSCRAQVRGQTSAPTRECSGVLAPDFTRAGSFDQNRGVG